MSGPGRVRSKEAASRNRSSLACKPSRALTGRTSENLCARRFWTASTSTRPPERNIPEIRAGITCWVMMVRPT